MNMKKITLKNTPAKYTADDIIQYLDDVPYSSFFFIDLEHPYFYTANSRLTLFADEKRWAIVFEKSGDNPRGRRIELEIDYFGNCLSNLQSSGRRKNVFNSHSVTLIDDEGLSEIEDEDEFGEIRKRAGKVKVRDQYVKIPTAKRDYKKWIPDILTRTYPKQVSTMDVARYVAYEYEQLCRATEQEVRHCIPNDLPEIMVINEWHHKSYSVYDNSANTGRDQLSIIGDPPSTYETYRLIAQVLETKNPAKFKPKLKPNNHWINWPQAGSL